MANFSGTYTQNQLPSDVFNSGDGDIKNYNGNAVRVGINNNGTRSLTDLGDYNTYQNQQNVTNATNQAKSAFDTLQKTDTGAVTDFLDNYKQDAANAVTGANAQFHIPQQTDMVNALNSRIQDLSTNMSNTGAGGFANAGQVDAAINSRYLPQLNTAQTNLNTSLGAAQQQEQIALQPDQQYESLLATNISAGMSGLTSTEGSILQTILGKLNAGVQLTQTEMTTGEALAQQAMTNAANITTAQIGQQYQRLGQGDTLVNTASNKIINPGILAARGTFG